MKKFLVVSLILLMGSAVSATTIDSESLMLDLENSRGEAEIKVDELTSSSFTYITSADIDSISAETGSRELDCQVEDLAIGDEIVCDTELRENFTVNLEYSFSGLVDSDKKVKNFRYSHPIYRPTRNFNLKVKLPQGAVIAQQETSNPLTPSTGSVGSDGQRIFVEWSEKPQIGDTLSFDIRYEYLDRSQNYLEIITGFAVSLILIGAIYLYWVRRNRESLDSVYPDLSEDEREIVELLEENDGRMLQKDVVDLSDYSKAKISGLVSQLVDKGIVEKEKEGRSNSLKISSKYSF